MDRQEEYLKHFLKHQADIKAFIHSVVRDPQTREDLIQEVALVLWRKFDSYDPARPFGAWARGIAAKKVMQDKHKSRRMPVLFSRQAIQAVAGGYARSEGDTSLEQEALRNCMKRLPAKSRELLVLRYEKALKLGEMGKRLNSTLDAVHKFLSRIRTGLRKCIERQVDVLQGRC